MNAKILLLLSVALAACGQMLFKKGMSFFEKFGFGGGFTIIAKNIVQVLINPYVFGGMLLYGLSTALWLLALSKTELSYAYPFTLLTFILVMLGSYFIFNESIQINRLIGSVVIIMGVVIVSLK